MTALIRTSIALFLVCLLAAPSLAQRGGSRPGSSNSTPQFRPQTPNFTPQIQQQTFSQQQFRPQSFTPSQLNLGGQQTTPTQPRLNLFNSQTGNPGAATTVKPPLQQFKAQQFNNQAGNPTVPLAPQAAPILNNQRYNAVVPNTNNQRYNAIQGQNSQAGNPAVPQAVPGTNSQAGNPAYLKALPGTNQGQNAVQGQNNQAYNPSAVQGQNNQANNPVVANNTTQTSFYNQAFPRPDVDSPWVQKQPQTLVQQQEPAARQTAQQALPETLVFSERYIKVRNTSEEPIKLTVRYYCDLGQGQKQWCPPGGEAATYTVQPGTDAYLTYNGGRIRAEKIRFEALAASGKSWTPYRARDLFLVPDRQGERTYAAAGLSTFVVTLRN